MFLLFCCLACLRDVIDIVDIAVDVVVLITSCVWCVRNAESKYHDPDLALSWIYPLDNIFLVKHMLDRMFNASVFVLCVFVTMGWRLLSR
jgi:hypothetical protein